MIKALFRNSLRSLVKQMPYSFVNIIGLTIGVTSVLMIIIWISVETSFDNFHKDKDRIFRIGLVMKTPNKEMNLPDINAPAGPEFGRTFPQIEKIVRFVNRRVSVIFQEKTTSLEVFYTDSSFFDLFTFDLSAGSKKNCLESSQGVVLTQSAVKKIFGAEDPLGKWVMISGARYVVTAVAKDPPVNTSLQFECLAPLSVVEKDSYVHWDGGLTCYTYLKLAAGADPGALNKQFIDYMEVAINKRFRQYGYLLTPYLLNIRDIHLNSDSEYDLGDKGSKTMVFMFAGIGLLILLIACFNFVNISTALAFRRAKEVSIKKVFGSDKKTIILFFITESAIAIFISLLLAFLLLKILLPVVSGMLSRTLTLTIIPAGSWILILSSLFVFCTIFASFYSSFYLSSINPLVLLTGVYRGTKRQVSRSILVTFQFAISIALIIVSFVINSQMKFIKRSDKGFNEKNILLVNMNSKTSGSYDLIKSKLSSLTGVISVAKSAGGLPGVEFTSNGYVVEGIEKPLMLNALFVDETYLNTMGMHLIEGRNFRNVKEDVNKAIINQTFAKSVGWTNPLGKSISRNSKNYEVIGLVKDFNTSSFYKKIEPLFMTTVLEWPYFETIIIKYQPGSVGRIIKSLEAILKEIDPIAPFEHEFLEDELASTYSNDQKLNMLFLILSVIAILISCLGLFGLATFSTQSRVKEIGIRKINGAMITDIFRKFNYELLKWILVSFVIAAPISYYSTNKWLNNFAYKTSVGFWVIIFSGLIAVTIGLITVTWAANKASRSNPAETLRKE